MRTKLTPIEKSIHEGTLYTVEGLRAMLGPKCFLRLTRAGLCGRKTTDRGDYRILGKHVIELILSEDFPAVQLRDLHLDA